MREERGDERAIWSPLSKKGNELEEAGAAIGGAITFLFWLWLYTIAGC